MRKNLSIEGGKNLFTMLAKDLQLLDREYFFTNFRMDTRTFEDLLSWIVPIIKKSFFFYHNKIHSLTNYKAIKNKSNKTRQHKT